MFEVFLIVFGVSAAVLAVWVDLRWEQWRPTDLQRAALHVGLAWCIGRFVAPQAIAVAGQWFDIVGVVLVALAAAVYCLLAGLWLMRLCAGALRSGLHN